MLLKELALKKLENDLRIRRYSDTTIKRYLYITNLFLDFIKGNDIEKLTEKDVILYLDYLTKVRNYKASSYNNVNAILKFFLEVTLNKDIGYRRLPNVKVEIKEKVIPTKEEVLKIINNANDIKQKCWYALAYGSGLRCSEIARLKVQDIDSKNMKIKVSGKGKKERLTVLPIITLKLLRKYCKEYDITKYNKYLFEGKRCEHIHEVTISKLFKAQVIKLGLDKNISIHSLRRSFATHLLRMGVALEEVKELMGHNSITTTSSYMKVVYIEKEIKNPLDSESYEIYNSTNI